jgi:nucleoside-diphosphate-sugar epimerase
MTGKIAVIGAGGFVGTRLAESLVLNGKAGVRAIVRAYRSLASLARFGSAVSAELADAQDAASLERALRGCSTAVNLTTGAPSAILHTTRAIHDACVRAGVARLVHMSSAVVYGEVADPTTHDDSPPLTRHWMPYARAKAASEVWLRDRMEASPCQIAVLRPGIIWGVRSPHTLQIARSLADRSAYLVDEGQGVFNSIFIDNLIACVRACCGDSGDVTGFYNVADDELITWFDFYAAFADCLGCDVARIPRVSGRRFPWSTRALLDYAQSLALSSDVYPWMKSRLPDAAKSRIKAVLAGRYNYEGFTSEYTTRPCVDRELWHLQKVKHKLPTSKFARRFRFSPPVSFAEGVRRTVGWLGFIGYLRAEAVETRGGR